MPEPEPSHQSAAAAAWLAYITARVDAVTPEQWADLVDLAATWAHASRAWLAFETDRRHEVKCEVIATVMAGGASRSAAEKVAEEDEGYREALRVSREAERTVALAEAKQRHAELRTQAAIVSAA